VQAELTHSSVFKMSLGASISLALIVTINMIFYFIFFVLTKIYERLLMVDHLVHVFLICKNS
jgi:hypothetical protein